MQNTNQKPNPMWQITNKYSHGCPILHAAASLLGTPCLVKVLGASACTAVELYCYTGE